MGEQRRYERYAVAQNELLVALTLNSEHLRVGKLADIGKGGAAVEFLCTKSEKTDGNEMALSEIDIFKRDKGLFLSKAPCKIIYNNKVESEHLPSNCIAKMRCGLQFGSFTQEQHKDLAHILDRYAMK